VGELGDDAPGDLGGDQGLTAGCDPDGLDQPARRWAATCGLSPEWERARWSGRGCPITMLRSKTNSFLTLKRRAEPPISVGMSLGGGAAQLADVLIAMVERGASDLLLKVGNQPLIRIDGTLQPVSPGHRPLEPSDT
jgi:hypothetical protein